MSHTMIQALLLGLLAFFGKFDLLTGTSLITRPIVLGPIVGLILGDVQAGTTIGATLELAFLGQYSVGAFIPPNVVVGGILGTAFAITTGKGAEIAFTMAFPIALMMQIIDNVMFAIVRPMLAKVADKYAAQGNAAGISRIHFACGLLTCAMLAVIVFAGYSLGSTYIENIVNAIPSFITDGLSVACGMLPGLGFAMLIRMVINKKVAPFFFLGFALAAYFGVPVVGIAILGLIAVFIMFNFTGSEKPAMAAAGAGMEAVDDDDF